MNGHAEQSPISELLPAFEHAPFNLAPEREAELRQLIRERNIQFRFDRRANEMIFQSVNLFGAMGLVDVGVRGLERLWVHAYGAIYVYLQFQATGFTGSLSLQDTGEGRIVAGMLNWALHGELHGNTDPFPADFPPPVPTPPDEQRKLTNELFLGAAGFAVLHEIGHIVRGHSGGNLPRDVAYRQEFEADEWAYDWVMDCWRVYSKEVAVFQKRSMLIAALFGLIAINQVFAPRVIENSKHPNTIDRLLRFLLKHANEDSGLPVALAWVVPAVTIHLHLSQVLREQPPQFDSARKYFNAIRDLLDKK